MTKKFNLTKEDMETVTKKVKEYRIEDCSLLKGAVSKAPFLFFNH